MLTRRVLTGDRVDVEVFNNDEWRQAPGGVHGGLYEGTFCKDVDGIWRIQRWQITSSWGWGGEPAFQYFKKPTEWTQRGGRPVTWTPRR